MHTMKTNPDDLVQMHEDAVAREEAKAVDFVLALVDAALLEDQKRIRGGGASRGFTRVEVDATRPLIERAVQALCDQGFKAHHDHDSDDNDGPGFYSPSRDYITVTY